jgi:hypothetical protein
MRVVREGTHHPYARLGARIGGVNNAERRLAARHIGQRHAHILGGRELTRHRCPQTECRQCRFRIFAGGHGLRIGQRQAAAMQRAKEIEVRCDGKLELRVRGCDQHEMIAEQVFSRSRGQQTALIQVVHPFRIG